MITAIANTDGTVDLSGVIDTEWALTCQMWLDANKTVPMNLTGYQAEGYFVTSKNPRATIIFPFVCLVLPYDATTNPGNNTVSISVSSNVNAACTAVGGFYFVRVFNGDNLAEKILKGKLILVF